MKHLKKLVAKHGEKHRELIANALAWFEKQKPDPGRKRRLIGPEAFVDALIKRETAPPPEKSIKKVSD